MSWRDWQGALDVAPEVADALDRNRPVVVLETAVVSHGLPPPVAVHTAEQLDQEVRGAGAVPAPVAVVDGRVVVGAAGEFLARLTDAGTWKVAERDLAVAVAQHATGGLAVSATVAVAYRLGAPVVATGGIGGVHLGGHRTWDVSGDLQALARYPVAVVCSGAKAVCDPALTLEYLDTAGVTVVGYRTDRFPYFYAQDSGFPVPHRADTPQQVASILLAKRALGQSTGLLVANPVPEHAALTYEEVVRAVRAAVSRALARGLRGGDLTPYLLSAVAERTGGRSVDSNLALLRCNARLAAEVAVAYVQLAGAAEGPVSAAEERPTAGPAPPG